MVDKAEIDDARTELEQRGFDPNDFDFRWVEETVRDPQGRQGPIKGKLHVFRASNETLGTYEAATATDWLTPFLADVDRGRFG